MTVFESMSPAERSLRAKQAAHTMWAQTPDRTARTANMRAGLLAKFEREVDPDGTLPPDERARRVEAARKAQQAKASRLAAKKRRENAANNTS